MPLDPSDSGIAQHLFPYGECPFHRSGNAVLRSEGRVSASDYMQISLQDAALYVPVIGERSLESVRRTQHMQDRSCGDELHVGSRHQHLVGIHPGQHLAVAVHDAYSHICLSECRVVGNGLCSFLIRRLLLPGLHSLLPRRYNPLPGLRNLLSRSPMHSLPGQHEYQ